jgi:transposase
MSAEVRAGQQRNNLASDYRIPRYKTWCKDNNVEIVFTPTNASWLNRIECHFTALKKFAIKNSNYKNHKELGSVIRRYLIWRNKNAEDKTIKDIENKVNFS